METSTDIGQLAAALAKAQGEMGGALKDSANPFFKSKYADLEAVWTACRKALSENKLAVIQTTDCVEIGIRIITTLVHESGQWIRGVLPIMAKDQTPQGTGSAITYARRYALAAMVGVYQTDDDAEAAHGRHTSPKGHVDPRGDDWRQEDMKKAEEMAQRFRKALEIGLDEPVYELHLECVPHDTFYIAVSTLLSAPEKREIKEIVARVRDAMPKMLANGKSAPAAR